MTSSTMTIGDWGCAGDLSRNRSVGIRIGKGEKLSDIMKDMTAVAEGVLTSRWMPNVFCVLHGLHTIS
jgi:glycerol-3-phosphate dehydrogenase